MPNFSLHGFSGTKSMSSVSSSTDSLASDLERIKTKIIYQVTSVSDLRQKHDVLQSQTLTERIDRVLKESFLKMQIALVLPNLLNRYVSELTGALSQDDYSDLLKFCENYNRRSTEIESKITSLTSEEESSFAVSQEDEKEVERRNMILIDFKLLQAVGIIVKNGKLCSDLPRYTAEISENAQEFLRAMQNIFHIAQRTLGESSETETTKDRKLHKSFHSKDSMRSIAEVRKHSLREKSASLQWKIANKQALIERYHLELNEKKWQNNIRIQADVYAANSRMHDLCVQSEQRQIKLMEDLETIKSNYKQVLNENLSTYRELRDKKNHILDQVKNWIKKYDRDIGQKIEELDNLQEELKKRTEILNDFMKEFNRQEEEFTMVFNLKEAEERAAQEEKMMLFMMNRAARIIQQAWEEYKKLKKKPKGKKKGKK